MRWLLSLACVSLVVGCGDAFSSRPGTGAGGDVTAGQGTSQGGAQGGNSSAVKGASGHGGSGGAGQGGEPSGPGGAGGDGGEGGAGGGQTMQGCQLVSPGSSFNQSTLPTNLQEFADGGAGVDYTNNPFLEVIWPGGGNFRSAGVETKTSLNITNKCAIVEAISCPLESGVLCYLSLEVDEGAGQGDSFAMVLENGMLSATVKFDDAVTQPLSVPYVAGAHRWWRVGNLDGFAIWETSTDGLLWAPFEQLPWTTDTEVVVSVGVSVLSESPEPGTADFDNFNREP